MCGLRTSYMRIAHTGVRGSTSRRAWRGDILFVDECMMLHILAVVVVLCASLVRPESYVAFS